LISARLSLDLATRKFFEPRFGHDFRNVRVHADAKAAESARAGKCLGLYGRAGCGVQGP
jgi:hypothetical protein